jgi:hypothetical protein
MYLAEKYSQLCIKNTCRNNKIISFSPNFDITGVSYFKQNIDIVMLGRGATDPCMAGDSKVISFLHNIPTLFSTIVNWLPDHIGTKLRIAL